ncbi:GHKL domain-containing protein [Psychrobacillus sp. INOP01]|uniref:ATP-binding protein n=1 Tax=Psychrobacillus sp. INOP01 TaxID=2829187 RepID=UPI001BAB0A08|nr:ATP-binding protein [Psychrobacillus sp. INOP01]QUG40155.1 GHKL domain-containing protein [Psychrobacillus sp. INOP01]
MKSHKVKIIFVLSTVLLLFFSALNVYTSYVRMKNTVEESVANQSLEAAKSIASSIDVETYQKFLDNPEKNEYFREIEIYLSDAREKLGSLYVYTLKVDNPKVSKQMILGHSGKLESLDNYRIGDACTVPEEQVKKAYEGKTYVTKVLKDPSYGDYLSVGAPIKNDEGKILGYLGIDTSADTINQIKGEALERNTVMLVFNGVFIFIVIGSFLFMQRWYQREVAKEVGHTEETYQTEIKTLITSVSSVRHDFSNHILVLHGLLKIGESDKALQYATSLFNEVKTIESIKVSIDHPGLSILLQTKKIAAQNHRIDMDIAISHVSFERIKTTDLIIILSNLIDNAMDASIALPEGERKITIECTANNTHYLFKITNTGPQIREKEQIFKQGYSTKNEEKGKIRGQGLFIVKEVVNKYNGKISIESTAESETTAIVEIPLK